MSVNNMVTYDISIKNQLNINDIEKIKNYQLSVSDMTNILISYFKYHEYDMEKDINSYFKFVCISSPKMFYLKLKSFIENVKNNSKILSFILIEKNHWTLINVRKESGFYYIYYYDSLNNNNFKINKKKYFDILNNLISVYSYSFFENGKKHQNDSSNCGIYVITTLRLFHYYMRIGYPLYLIKNLIDNDDLGFYSYSKIIESKKNQIKFLNNFIIHAYN